MIFECEHRLRDADGSCPLCLPPPPVVLFLVGAPGVGKTTIARELIARAGGVARWVDRPKWTVCRDLALAGHYAGDAHDGGDTIAYNGARPALEYWECALARRCRLTVLDGARFATKPSLAWVAERARVIVAHLVLGEVEAERRRVHRACESGRDSQDPQGATTAARNFAAHARAAHAGAAVEINAERDAREVIDEIAALVQT